MTIGKEFDGNALNVTFSAKNVAILGFCLTLDLIFVVAFLL